MCSKDLEKLLCYGLHKCSSPIDEFVDLINILINTNKLRCCIFSLRKNLSNGTLDSPHSDILEHRVKAKKKEKNVCENYTKTGGTTNPSVEVSVKRLKRILSRIKIKCVKF